MSGFDEKDFAKRLRILLAEKDLKHKDFAEKCNIPYNTIRSYLDSKSKVSVENAIAMAEVLDVTLDYLLSGEDLAKKKNGDITPQGIFDALNYLISAFGEGKIKKHEIEPELWNEEGCPIRSAKYAFCILLDNEYIQNYLGKVLSAKDIRTDLEKIDKNSYKKLLESWANSDNLLYIIEDKTLQPKFKFEKIDFKEIDDNEELPF